MGAKVGIYAQKKGPGKRNSGRAKVFLAAYFMYFRFRE
jgi:hypothetical protein